MVAHMVRIQSTTGIIDHLISSFEVSFLIVRIEFMYCRIKFLGHLEEAYRLSRIYSSDDQKTFI